MRRNKMAKMRVSKGSMRIKAYPVLVRCIDEGVRYGYNRAFKHCETPGEKEICEAVYQAVLNELCDWFTFEPGEEEND